MEAEDAGAAAPGAGAALRSAREARSLSVEEVSTDLRIEAHLLHALESENYASLGAPVFAKGYIRQYAARLGLDPAPLVASYLDATGHTDVRIEPSRAIKLRDSQQLTGWVLALLALALVIVFLLVWWFREPLGNAVTRTTGIAATEPQSLPFPEAEPIALPAESPTATTSLSADAAGPRAELPASGDAPVAVATAPEPAVREAAPDLTAGAPEVAETVADTAVGNAEPPAATAAASASAAGSAATAAAASTTGAAALPGASEAAAGPAVELAFVEDCWVEITDADGRRLLYGLMEAGSRRQLSGPAPLDVFLGNAAAARIQVDGREFTVPGGARRGNLARFAISAQTD